MFRRIGALIFVLATLLVTVAPNAGSADPCTNPNAALTVQCLPGGTVVQMQRRVCFYVWVEALCSGTKWPDPGYRATWEPNANQPLVLRVGAVHEHSSYSDGDPAMIPADYYKAAKTGHNTADSGGDTGVKLDFMFGSEHSDNAEIPITTAYACIDPSLGPLAPLACFHGTKTDHYYKWPAELRQAKEATNASFTAMRGFEWTNDYFNHMNVYFSTNFDNVKVDGSYASMDIFWDWLRRPVAQGGGADALVTFNHPGGDPHLTPFDDGFPHTKLLAEFPGGGNWNDLAYVPDMDKNLAAMEVNGGDDIAWYVKALTRGWHIGAVANEDEHEREWSSSNEGKTLMLTRGRGYRDYYWAMQQHRTIAIRDPLVSGSPGTKAIFPTIHYYANGTSIQDPAATLLGSTITAPGQHILHFEASGLPAGSRVALISDARGGQQAPAYLGAVAGDGTANFSKTVTARPTGQDWYFAVICPASAGGNCGKDQNYIGVTAPIWFGSPS